ncbi:MAG TPA: hypothetical protein VI072_23145 [Polyangiaceae bacterium]
MKRTALVALPWLLAGCADVLGLDFDDKRLAEPTLQVLTDPTLEQVTDPDAPCVYFGTAIDIDGDTALIGSPPGCAFVAERAPSGEWRLVQTLKRPAREITGPRVWNGFGGEVALDGEWALIADYGNMAEAFSEPGEVFVFRRGPNGFDWTERVLRAGLGQNRADRFGLSMDLEGSTAVIGAWGDNELIAALGEEAGTKLGKDRGAVYVYTLQDEDWVTDEKLTLQDPRLGDKFGAAVALEGDTLVASASGRDGMYGTNTGAAYVFTRGASFGDAAPEDLWPSGEFLGNANLESVSVSGNQLFAGAMGAGEGRGVAYAFESSGQRWNPTPTVFPRGNAERATLTAGSRFGKGVAVDGDLAVITTREEENVGAGYLYRRDRGEWAFSRRVDSERGESFGFDVAVQRSTVAIGAPLRRPIGVVYFHEFPDQ